MTLTAASHGDPRVLAHDRGARVRVVVADDHEAFRKGVARALRASPLFEVVAEAEDGCRALEQTAAHRPHVALLDYRLPGMDGIAIIGAIARDGLPTRTLLLSAYDESGIVDRALRAGAAGYLSKEASREQISSGVIAVARGETVLSPELAARVVGEVGAGKRGLTDTERRVVRLIAAGTPTPEIAAALSLGVATVKRHVAQICETLRSDGQPAAVTDAIGRRLLD